MELYVTDLDGTLLNSDKKGSQNSQELLNKFINEGLEFTIATARTPATVVDLLKGIDIKLPVILMNGVVTYDIHENKYLDVKDMKKDDVLKILKLLKDHKRSAFVYGIKNNKLYVYHQDFQYDSEYNFYKERCTKKLKEFVKVDEYEKAIEGSAVVNVLIFDTLDNIKNMYKSLKDLKSITCNYYEDIYEKGAYFLEIYSSDASKAKAIKNLSNLMKDDKIICFGDNINDIPMFETANEGYAVENAVTELKNIATAIIESNNQDAVAKFIEKRFICGNNIL